MRWENEGKSEVIYSICLSGMLVAIGILIGAFATVPAFGGNKIYFIGAIVFAMPMILPLRYSFISSLIVVAVSDVLQGWAAYCWISMIVYGIAVLIIYFANHKLEETGGKKKFVFRQNRSLYIVSLIVASLVSIALYAFLELLTFGEAMALKELFTDLIQYPIITTISVFITIALWKVREQLLPR